MAYVLIDENVRSIDRRVVRVVVAACEVANKMEINQACERIRKIKDDFCRNHPECRKFHSAELDSKSLSRVADIVSSIPMRVKIFVYYWYGPQSCAKVNCIRWVCNYLFNQLHRNGAVNFVVESASEYNNVIKSSNLTTNTLVSIIPDIYCSYFCAKLYGVDQDSRRLREMRDRLDDKIVLELYNLSGRSFERRDNMLRW